MSNIKEQELKVSDNTAYIKQSTDNIKKNGAAIIDSAVTRQVENYKQQLNKIPKIYQNMKNNLTVNNNKEIKRMNENIANTGNHTASGYAISKRLNNTNNYNKQLSDIDTQKNEAISDLQYKIQDTILQGDIDKAKLNNDADQKNLEYYLNEKNRQDNYKLSTANFRENQRMNDSNIEKNNFSIKKTINDIILDNKEDLREEDANRRENDMHNITMEYLPKKNDAELESIKADTDLTLAKIEETKIKNQTTKSSSSGGGSGSNDNVMSKMSSKAIADSIKEQIGSVRYDSYGTKTVQFSSDKAYAILMAWKTKYNLPNYVVNDASIYLGIQDYI